MNGRYVIWPEREPEKAVFALTRCAKWWALNGPMGLSASFRGRRMRCWFTEDIGENPNEWAVVLEAALWPEGGK